MNKGSGRAHSLTGEHERDEAVAAVDVRMHGWARVGSFALVVIADDQPRAQTASKYGLLLQGENRSINGRFLRMQVPGGRSTPSDPAPWDHGGDCHTRTWKDYKLCRSLYELERRRYQPQSSVQKGV